MQKFNQNNQSIIKSWRNIVFASLFIIITACDSFCGVGSMDCGCIEAEDFGEFEQFVLEVKSNNADSNCTLDQSRNFDSPSQPDGLKECLSGTTGTVASIAGFFPNPLNPDSDSDPSNDESSRIIRAGSCKRYSDDASIDPNKKQLILPQCIEACITECQTILASNKSASTTFWEPTSTSFEIPPFSEIHITAIGSVNLSGSQKIGPIFTNPTSFNFQSRNATSEKIFDVKFGSEQFIDFHGSWIDNADSGNSSNIQLGIINDDISLRNGARRLVAYIEPNPAGYLPNATGSPERANTLGTPFSIDERLWDCSYDATDTFTATDFTLSTDSNPNNNTIVPELVSDLTQSTCSSREYHNTDTDGNGSLLDPDDIDNGYPNIRENQLHLGIYEVRSSKLMDNLGEVGGFIRYNGDNLTSFDNEPFGININGTRKRTICRAFGNCNSDVGGGTKGIDYVNDKNINDGNGGGVTIGRSLATGEETYTNGNNFPVSVSFINLHEGNGCDGEHLSVVHTMNNTPNVTPIYPERNGGSNNSNKISIDKNWSSGSNLFLLEPGDTITISGVTKSVHDGLVVQASKPGSTINITSFNINYDLSNGPVNENTVIATISPSDASATYSILENSNNYFAIDSTNGNITLTATGVAVANNDNLTNNQSQIINDSINIQTTSNCARYYAYRIDKVHEIEIKKSGNINFSSIGSNFANPDNSCSLDLKIINPLGDRATDFYEYSFPSGELGTGENLNTAENPLAVPISQTKNAITSSNIPTKTVINNFSREIFVRKGQKIRFLPSSWNGYWVAGSNAEKTAYRKCGIGMAMKINPRLALLCRGTKDEEVKNNDCVASDTVGQCKDESCFDRNGDAYCPNECDGNSTTSPACSGVTLATCAQCTANSNGINPTKELRLDQCYDLENYQGRVSDIPDGIPTTTNSDNTLLNASEVDTIDLLLEKKGLKKLDVFDGFYGNLENFSENGLDSNSKTIYRFNEYVVAKHDGQLKFLLLDGKDFNKFGTSYGGNSGEGYVINLTGNQQFFNGEMMEVKLCNETETGDCSGLEVTQITTQPQPIKIGGIAPNFVVQSHYKFDKSGKLVNFDNPNLADVAFDNNPQSANNVNTGANDTLQSNFTRPGTEFYVHSVSDGNNCITTTPRMNEDCSTGKCDGKLELNPDYEPGPFRTNNVCTTNLDVCKKQFHCNATKSKIRLSFRIKDPDVKDCSPDSTGEMTGIKLENPFKELDSNGIVSDVARNGICGTNETIGTGTGQCSKEFYCASVYDNNSGSYKVVIKVKDIANGSRVSSLVDSVISPVIQIMDGTPKGVLPVKEGQAERVYKLVINDPTFKTIVRIIFILAITFYGVGYLMGVSQFSQSEIISRVVKIGLIYLFIGSDGWEWFDRIFVTFFKEGTDYLTFLMATAFDTSPELETALANNNFYDKSVLFASIDRVFDIFFADVVQSKIAGLLFSGWFGWAYMFIIYSAFMLYIYAVANAVLLYLTSQIFISILFVVGPIFFLCLFFNQTKEMFDKWLGQLIAFSLQQIFLLTTLAFFNMMMYEVLKLALGYSVCWNEVLVLNIPFRIALLSFWTISTRSPDLGSLAPINSVTNVPGMPSLFSILFIWVIASLMKQFISFMTDLAATIGGGIKASMLGSGISKGVEDAKGIAKSTLSKAYSASGGPSMKDTLARADHYLFNSGENAKKAKTELKAKNKKDGETKADMARSSNRAWKDYSTKNAAQLVKLGEQDQKNGTNKLQQLERNIRNNASIKAGVDSGLSEADSKRLLSETGFKIEGNNVAKNLAKMGWQATWGKNKAQKDKTTGVKFSGLGFKKALKETDSPEERNMIMHGARAGIIGIGNAKKIGAPDEGKMRELAKKELKAKGEISRFGFSRLGINFRSESDTKAIEEQTKRNMDQHGKGVSFDNSAHSLTMASVRKLGVDKGEALLSDERHEKRFKGEEYFKADAERLEALSDQYSLLERSKGPHNKAIEAAEKGIKAIDQLPKDSPEYRSQIPEKSNHQKNLAEHKVALEGIEGQQLKIRAAISRHNPNQKSSSANPDASYIKPEYDPTPVKLAPVSDPFASPSKADPTPAARAPTPPPVVVKAPPAAEKPAGFKVDEFDGDGGGMD